MNLHSIKKLDFFTSKPEYEKFMTCSTCFKVGDSVFPSQEKLVKHIQMEHNRKSPGLIGCAKCQKFFLASNDGESLSNLHNHIKAHVISKVHLMNMFPASCLALS